MKPPFSSFFCEVRWIAETDIQVEASAGREDETACLLLATWRVARRVCVNPTISCTFSRFPSIDAQSFAMA